MHNEIENSGFTFDWQEKMEKVFQSDKPILDAVDRRLIASLNRQARSPVAELARQVGMSAPSVTERLRRLEEQGVITGYRVELDPAALGYGLTAIVRIRPLPGQLRKVEALIVAIDAFVECDKVTGDDCFVARLVLRSISELDGILERITAYAETNTAIVKTSPIKRRLPPLAA